MLKKVDRVLVRVPSIKSGVTYYRDVLGMKLVREDQSVAMFELGGGGELVLHADPDLPDQATYFLVEDVRALYARRAGMKLQFSAPPAPASRGYRATVKDPFGNIMLIIDQSMAHGAATETASAGGGAGGGGSLFAGVEQKAPVRKDLLVQLYEKIGRTADDLPYTPHFESIYNAYVAEAPEPKPSKSEVWRHLLNLRKRAALPKLGPAKSKPPEITDEQREMLKDMLGEDIGRRDRLPYTKRFDEIVDRFNKGIRRAMSPHLVWRLVATLAK
jgi:catechol 2,3-dioxygenase-like lactoylglutathione lyase family enzyme